MPGRHRTNVSAAFVGHDRAVNEATAEPGVLLPNTLQHVSETPAQRGIPSVDRIVREMSGHDLPRLLIVNVARTIVSEVRRAAIDNPTDAAHPEITADRVLEQVKAALTRLEAGRIRPVINATGIILHTNLGRAPLGLGAVQKIGDTAAHYSTLEYDLVEGTRGRRGSYVESALAALCGADAATVVNNCAAALVLILRHFATRKGRREVVISRGELVQIGGGFRVPEILAASGARLREVGTTNQTTLDDYRQALSSRTAMILRVHRSNFFMGGFVRAPAAAELSALAREAAVPFVEDLGSGATFDTRGLGGGEHEPTPTSALADGADLVCFSGDKLLGGPQAGIIAGRKTFVHALKKQPFFRALRCDKLVLSALEATVDAHLAGQQPAEVPAHAMMRLTVEELRPRAQHIVDAITSPQLVAKVGHCQSQVGGGSLPQTLLDSVAVDLLPHGRQSAEQWAKALRLRRAGPIIGLVTESRLRLDLRTVFPTQDEALITALRQLAAT